VDIGSRVAGEEVEVADVNNTRRSRRRRATRLFSVTCRIRRASTIWLRSTRWRLGAGLQIRYEWFTLLGNFMFDIVKPGDTYADESLPDRLNRQWQADVGVGLTL
jgi:hypothetical protein